MGKLLTSQNNVISILASRHGLMLNQIPELYEQHFNEPLDCGSDLKQWLLDIPGVKVDDCDVVAYFAQLGFEKRVKILMDEGVLKVSDLSAKFRERFAIEPILTSGSIESAVKGIPGVQLTNGILTKMCQDKKYVGKQLESIVSSTKVHLLDLLEAYMTTYGYHIPDAYPLNEYIEASGNLTITDSHVIRKPNSGTSSATSAGAKSKAPADDLATQQKNIIAIVKAQPGIQISKLFAEYTTKFGKSIDYSGKAKKWLLAIPGIRVADSQKVNYTSPAESTDDLATQQKHIIALVNAQPGINVAKLFAEYTTKFGKRIDYGGKAKQWLLAIPGIQVDNSQAVTYNAPSQPKGAATPATQTVSTEATSNIEDGESSHLLKFDTLSLQQKNVVGIVMSYPGLHASQILTYYQSRHNAKLDYGGKLQQWLLTIPGIEINKSQGVTYTPSLAKLVTQQQNVVAIVTSNQGLHASQILTHYQSRHNAKLDYGGKLQQWLLAIPGIEINTAQGVTYTLSPPKQGIQQQNVVTLVKSYQGCLFVSDIIPTYATRFGPPLDYGQDFRKWLLAIPGMRIDDYQMVNYTEGDATAAQGSPAPEASVQNVTLAAHCSSVVKPVAQVPPTQAIPDVVASTSEPVGNASTSSGSVDEKIVDRAAQKKLEEDRLRIIYILGDKKMPLEEFAEKYANRFNETVSNTWVKSRQQHIPALAYLNGKVSYQWLTEQECVQYVKNFFALVGAPFPFGLVAKYFKTVYGFFLPSPINQSMVDKLAAEDYSGAELNPNLEIMNPLRPLSRTKRRLFLYLAHMQKWSTLDDFYREIHADIADSATTRDTIESLCLDLPGVSVLNGRVKHLGSSAKCEAMRFESLIYWCREIRLENFTQLYETVFGMRLTKSPIELSNVFMGLNYCTCNGVSVKSTLEWTSDIPVPSSEEIVINCGCRVSRICALVKANPGLRAGEYERLYEITYGIPPMPPTGRPNFGVYISQLDEISSTKGKLTLKAASETFNYEGWMKPEDEFSRIESIVNRGSVALTSLPEIYEKEYGAPIELKRMLKAYLESLGLDVQGDVVQSSPRCSTAQAEETGSSSSESTLVGNSSTDYELQLQHRIQAILQDLQEVTVEEMLELYKIKYGCELSGVQAEREFFISAGCCALGKNLHMNCKIRLVELLREGSYTKTELLSSFMQRFGRSPCYKGTLSSYLESIGYPGQPSAAGPVFGSVLTA